MAVNGSEKPEAVPGSNAFKGVITGRQMGVSPDGRILVYLVSQVNQETRAGAEKLAFLSLESTTGPRLVDVNLQISGGVLFTPDGKAVAYPVRENGVDNIWLQPLDGSLGHTMTHFDSDQIASFRWSPDGKTLTLVRSRSESDVVLLEEARP